MFTSMNLRADVLKSRENEWRRMDEAPLWFDLTLVGVSLLAILSCALFGL